MLRTSACQWGVGGNLLLCVAAIVAAFCGNAHARRANPHGFAGEAESSVPYTHTPFETALQCASMDKVVRSNVALTAQLIAASGGVPEHCRIRGTIPAEITFDINLPSKWNGRLWMYGNGGYAGESPDAPPEAESRAAGLARGFATVRQDTGHRASREPLGTFALRRQDKVIDLGYRAVHETVTLAKALVQEFYGRAVSYSYWDGCSTGGRQGMMAAARYPSDFDGILAAAPTLHWSDITIKGLSNQLALDAAPTLTLAKLGIVHKAVIAKCDAKDGVADGLVSEPAACNFDPIKDLPRCANGPGADACFSDSELDAIARIHRGPVVQGREYFPQPWGIEHPATATRWLFSPDGGENGLTQYAESYVKYMAFDSQDPVYNWRTQFNFDVDPHRMGRINSIMNPQPELAAFKERGGKILSYWGLADAALNPVMGTRFYDAVVAKHGLAQTQSFTGCSCCPEWHIALEDTVPTWWTP